MEVLQQLTTIEFVFGDDIEKRFVDNEQSITLSVVSDVYVENDETFSVHLSTMDPDVILSPHAYTVVTILNNDGEVYQLSVYYLYSKCSYMQYIYVVVY